jgi:hypothetical protein
MSPQKPIMSMRHFGKKGLKIQFFTNVLHVRKNTQVIGEASFKMSTTLYHPYRAFLG